MREIIILTRSDLIPAKKLMEVKDIEYPNLEIQSTKYQNAAMVIFLCNLTGKMKILKNRAGSTGNVDISVPEGENMLLSFILGIA